MWVIWLPLSLGGTMAAWASEVAGTLLPNILPAGLALGVYAFTWPTGHAMTLPVGNTDDAELYEEPR